MRIFGALIAVLGGLIQLLAASGFYAIGEEAAMSDSDVGAFFSGLGAISAGVAVLILIGAGFAFLSSGRFAGVLLMVLSVFGFFTGGGILMALPFLGGLLVMVGRTSSSVTMGGNYT